MSGEESERNVGSCGDVPSGTLDPLSTLVSASGRGSIRTVGPLLVAPQIAVFGYFPDLFAFRYPHIRNP